jgi:hypothetical protein
MEQNSGRNLFNLIMGEQLENMAKPLNTFANFYSNFKALNDSGDWQHDKNYHAKANCESAKYNDPKTVLFLDYGKEVADMLSKNIINKNSLGFKANLKDSLRDLEADNYGYAQGFSNPYYDCNILLNNKYLEDLNK